MEWSADVSTAGGEKGFTRAHLIALRAGYGVLRGASAVPANRVPARNPRSLVSA